MIKEKIANLDSAWNLRGDKFCIGSSSGFLYIGFYNPINNYWIAYPVNEEEPSHKASVTCCRFDTLSSRVIVSGSLDGTVQINSVY